MRIGLLGRRSAMSEGHFFSFGPKKRATDSPPRRCRAEAELGISLTARPAAAAKPPLARIVGQPYRSGFALRVGGRVWFPLRAFSSSLPAQASEQQVRGLLKGVLGGLGPHILWSAIAGA